MKGLIFGIKRMEIHDGDGLRSTVFFKGCPLKCRWCHNPEGISPQKQIALFKEKCNSCNTCKNLCPASAVSEDKIDYSRCTQCLVCVNSCPTGALTLYGQEYDTDTLVAELLQDELFFKNSGGGVTLSGGECLFQPAFATELAQKLCDKGISVFIDTCGFVKREVLEQIIPFTDKFLYDIKAIDPAVHKACTGQDNELILNNLKFLSQNGCKIEIRMPLVMGHNDRECEKAAEFLAPLKGIEKIKVLQYHALAASRYNALGAVNTLPHCKTTLEDVEKAVSIFKSYGLNAVNGSVED